jgi:hypothetical protein
MSETVTNEPTVAEPATVSASALAKHLDCSRTYIGKLEADGVVQRQDGAHSRSFATGRAGNRSGHVRYAPKAEAITEHQHPATVLICRRAVW